MQLSSSSSHFHLLSPSIPWHVGPALKRQGHPFYLSKLPKEQSCPCPASTDIASTQQRLPCVVRMNQTARPMAFYNEFDTFAEPGRRPQPMFMRRAKTRRSKTVVILSLICVLLMVWGWKSSGITIVSPSENVFESSN